MENKNRYTGILMHPVSFPGPHGIGCLGKETKELLKRFSSAGVGLWQILPLGPTGYGDSPYASHSSFAGNELLIDLRSLPGISDSSKYTAIADASFSDNGQRIDYCRVREIKTDVLNRAADDFLFDGGDKSFRDFCRDNASWLEDYALFKALAQYHNDSRWFLWPEKEAKRDEATLNSLKKQFEHEILRLKYIQYAFYTQWNDLHRYVNSLGMRIIGDLPIFVASDSADAWVRKDLLKIDGNCNQTVLAGCPPDAFSPEGQLWGNPNYDWGANEAEGFAWWKKRLNRTLSLVDIVRIDHFRGFAAAWETPAGSPNAVSGKWVKGPGAKFFKALFEDKSLKDRIIAEDLGVITPDVEKLRDSFKLPGMKIFEFAFDFKNGVFNASNAYLPHNCTPLSVAYTGTHDNQTARGWFNSLPDNYKDAVRRYLESDDTDVVWQMIRALMESSAKYVIFPIQDIIGLDDSSRMNVPSTVGTSNWSYRLNPADLEDRMLERLSYYNRLFGRFNEVER